MNDLKLIPIDGEPSPEDRKVMVAGMLNYHASKGHPRKVDTFTVLLKNSEGILVGMVMVSFLYNGMEIQTIWVDESIRGNGWGRKLLAAAEDEGIKRGSTISYTNTFTWQAPKFYEKNGYSLYGKLEGFPEGNALSYYSKKLI